MDWDQPCMVYCSTCSMYRSMSVMTFALQVPPTSLAPPPNSTITLLIVTSSSDQEYVVCASVINVCTCICVICEVEDHLGQC